MAHIYIYIYRESRLNRPEIISNCTGINGYENTCTCVNEYENTCTGVNGYKDTCTLTAHV